MLKRSRLALSATPEQNVQVLKKLLNESGDVEVPPTMNSLSKQLSASTIAAVKVFYLNDEISRPSPNTNDVITVTESGLKRKISIKHLLFSVKEVHGMFLKEHPEAKVGISKFFELKPEHVRSYTKMPHNVCVCLIHENLRCALKALQKAHQIFSQIKSDNEMHLNFTCPDPTVECFTSQCELCNGSKIFRLLEIEIENLFQTVAWMKWVKVDQKRKDDKTNNCNIEKVKKIGTIRELLDEIYDQAPDFLDHQFIKMSQATKSREMIERAMQDISDSAVIIVDFAEKFKCIQQNAPQSAHYGQTPVSIFTVAIYHRGFHPKAIASDCEKHCKEVVLSYIDEILEKLPSSVKRVDIWSDNATSQFKNQYIMNSIETFEKRFKMKLVWNFYAPMHGKSVVDGIGGSLKRYVRDRIIAQDLQVNSAEDFVSVAKALSTDVILMNSRQIEERNSALKVSTIIKNSKQIPDIKKNHCFESSLKNSKKASNKIVSHKISQ